VRGRSDQLEGSFSIPIDLWPSPWWLGEKLPAGHQPVDPQNDGEKYKPRKRSRQNAAKQKGGRQNGGGEKKKG